MIPVSLHPINILSYGEEAGELDFTHFRLACLSGPNGHGKSALLDAMTWALWGQARKPSGGRQPDSSLLRIGQTRMQVSFVFDLGDTRYRVIRSFEKKRKGDGSRDLEFQYWDDAENKYRSLTLKTRSETQRLIDQTLRMDYDTFVNSSFLVQGRADEFTCKRPQERKAILGEILGLSRFDELQQLAREELKQLNDRANRTGARIESLDSELKRKPEVEYELKQCQKQHQQLTKQREALSKALEEKQALKSQLDGARLEQKNLISRKTDLEKQMGSSRKRSGELENVIEESRKQLEKWEEVQCEYFEYQEAEKRSRELTQKLHEHSKLLEKRAELQRNIDREKGKLENRFTEAKGQLKYQREAIAQSREILKQKDSVQRRFERFGQVKQEIARLEKVQEERVRIEEQRDTALKAVDQERNRIEYECRSLKEQVDRLNESVSKEKSLKVQLAEVEKKIRQFEEIERKLQETTEEGQELKSRRQWVDSESGRLQKLLDENREKIDLLKSGEESECPLCHSELDREHRDQLIAQLSTEQETERKNLAQLQKEGTLADKRIEQMRKDYRGLSEQLKRKDKHLSETARVKAELERIEKDKKESETAKGKLEGLRLTLAENRYASEQRELAGKREAQLAELEFDPLELKRLREESEELASVNAELKQLTQAEEGLVGLEQKEKKLTEEVATLRKSLEKEEYAKEIREDLSSVDQTIEKIAYDPSEHKKVEERKEKLAHVPALWSRLNSCKEQLPQLEKEHGELQASIREFEERLKEIDEKVERLNEKLKAEKEVEASLKQTRTAMEVLNKDFEETGQKLGALKQESERLEKAAQENKELKAERKKIQKDLKQYEILVEAFGPRGCQALIIENAVPEIQEEANHILARLTGNRVRVALESLREKKSGGMIETLDIRISDEMGTRDYEMYSGGEAFRTDLAIRIALSRLLARRAGTQLQTLIIDEGFGTQDAEGLAQVVEVLRDIASLFKKILVVTHLEHLKDAFPVRIEVSKHPEKGSTFRIVHS